MCSEAGASEQGQNKDNNSQLKQYICLYQVQFAGGSGRFGDMNIFYKEFIADSQNELWCLDAFEFQTS